MTRFFQYCMASLAILALSCGLASCSSDTPEPTDPQLPVNYANLAGNWQLESFGSHKLDEGTYLYIAFDRRNRTFELYDNLGSMYGQKRTGTYLLEDDARTETTILSGFYDNGVGTWAKSYTVTSLTATMLQLTATSTDGEQQVFRRIDTLPDFSE